MFNVSPRYVQYGKSINEKLPELADQIREGNLTITQGKDQLKRLERVQALKYNANATRQAKEQKKAFFDKF